MLQQDNSGKTKYATNSYFFEGFLPDRQYDSILHYSIRAKNILCEICR